MIESEKGLGRLPAVDERDRRHLMSAVVRAETPPPHRYYRTGPVLDQGATSSCVGHAWAAFLMAAPTMTRYSDPYVLYAGAQRFDEWPGEDYDGSSVRGGAKYLHMLGGISSYVWAWDAQTVADFLLGGHGTVVMGTTWTRDMFYPDKNGMVTPTGRFMGGHAYLCVGYSRTRGRFRFLNSWGKDWADRGRFWMLGEHVEQLIQDDGEAAAAIQVAS